jgi:hypothetical protein
VRKKDPNDVVDDFQSLLADSLDLWSDTCDEVTRNELRSNASVSAFRNAAIGLETFRSDWHIAAINRDSTAFVADLSVRIEQSIESRWPGIGSRVTLSLPKHPSLNLLHDLIDPEGGNLAFGDRDKWRARAGRELTDPYRLAVASLTDRDHQLLAAVVAIRDCISHRSRKSSDSMNAALADLAHADRALRRDVARVRPSGIGAYLFANASGTRRVERYHARLTEIAEAMRV